MEGYNGLMASTASAASGPISGGTYISHGGSAISVPIGIIIGNQNIAVPTDTAASVPVPWRPATRLSTKPIMPVAKWPAASGAARRAVRASSWRIEGREIGGLGEDMRVKKAGRHGADREWPAILRGQ